MKEKNFERFISEVSEDFDRTWRHHPPVIELRGWWWKKYVPHYRKMRDVMQNLIEDEWQHNYERIDYLWTTAEKEYGRSIMKDLFR